MNDELRGRIFFLLLTIPALVAAFTVHEFAHAWMANRLGDDTARRQGRLTLDPMVHIDPFGFLMIVLMALVGFPGLGWARPVPFQMRNLANPRRDSILIAIAGPISNLLQVPFWLFLLWIGRLFAERNGSALNPEAIYSILTRNPDPGSMWSVLLAILAAGVVVNIGLAAFNMIPLPPLDGHYVLEGLGPPFVTDLYNAIRPWSFVILIVLLQTPLLGYAVAPFYDVAYRLVARALGLAY